MSGVGGEAARKSIHVLLSLGAAAIAWRLPALTAATVLAAAAALALTIEVLRLASPGFGALFHRRLAPMLRAGEARGVTGATTLAIGYTLAAAAFPGRAAVAGILFTGVGDAVAAVVGKRWGRHRYPGGKSLEGSAAFFAVAFGIAWAAMVAGGPDGAAALGPAAVAGRAALAAGVVMAVEALTLRVDDNLYLPLVGAAVFRVITGF